MAGFGGFGIGGAVDQTARDAAASALTVANAALPKAGGAMTGAITTNSTFAGVDVAARDAVLTQVDADTQFLSVVGGVQRIAGNLEMPTGTVVSGDP